MAIPVALDRTAPRIWEALRGLGLATATTSPAFLPHLEQHIRGASLVSVTFPADQARERFRLDVPGQSARASDAQQEVAETIVEPLDVGQHLRMPGLWK